MKKLKIKKVSKYFLYTLLCDVFCMKAEVVKIDEMFTARIKKWYHWDWWYIGSVSLWKNGKSIRNYCLLHSEDNARDRLKWYTKTFEVIEL